MKGHGITREEHDAHVAHTGRPYTQGPIDRHMPNTVPVGLHEIPTTKPKPKPRKRRAPEPNTCTLAADCAAGRHEGDCKANETT